MDQCWLREGRRRQGYISKQRLFVIKHRMTEQAATHTLNKTAIVPLTEQIELK